MTQRAVPQKPIPRPEQPVHTKAYWEGTKRGELWVPRCKSCSRWFWAPRERCPHCFSDKIEWAKASGKARLHCYTTIYQPGSAAFRGDVPYLYAIVDLDEGVRMACNFYGLNGSKLTMEQMHDPLIIDIPCEAFCEEQRGDYTIVQFRAAVDVDEYRNAARAAWEAAGKTPPPVGPIIGYDAMAGARGLTETR